MSRQDRRKIEQRGNNKSERAIDQNEEINQWRYETVVNTGFCVPCPKYNGGAGLGICELDARKRTPITRQGKLCLITLSLQMRAGK